LIQSTSVTDRQTDRRPDDGKDARSILLSRVKTKHKPTFHRVIDRRSSEISRSVNYKNAENYRSRQSNNNCLYLKRWCTGAAKLIEISSRSSARKTNTAPSLKNICQVQCLTLARL